MISGPTGALSYIQLPVVIAISRGCYFIPQHIEIMWKGFKNRGVNQIIAIDLFRLLKHWILIMN